MRYLSCGLLVIGLGLWTNARGANDQNAVAAPHAKQLVAVRGDKLAPFDAQRFLRAPYLVLYFGAGWCPDCRKFSPSLVKAYDQQPATSRRFEVLLISQDRSEAEMRQFMTREKMRWPALAYSEVAGAKDLARYHPNGAIPWLAVIDHSGTVLLQSESDKDAEEVLKRLEARTASPDVTR